MRYLKKGMVSISSLSKRAGITIDDLAAFMRSVWLIDDRKMSNGSGRSTQRGWVEVRTEVPGNPERLRGKFA